MNRREFLVGGATVTTLATTGCLGGDDIETDEETAFVTVWQTTGGWETEVYQIQLPLLSEGTYDFKVEWGDGTSDTIDSYDDSAVKHSYDKPGLYVVTIHGIVEGWSFVGALLEGDANKLFEIRHWGDFDVSSDEGVVHSPRERTDFTGAENLRLTAEDTPKTEAGDSLAELFRNSGLSVATGLSEWDVSNVRDMSFMFSGAESFVGDVSGWDVSNVESMENMFAGASSFDGDVSGWDVSNVKDMRWMFNGAESFDGDVSGWDVSRVESMERMFLGAEVFDGDVSEWDVSNVETMEYMFGAATSFDGDVSEWDVSNVETMREMFAGAASFDGDVSEWDVSNVEDMRWMFDQANLSRENYDALLVAWAELDLQENVSFSAGHSQYSSGEPAEARQHIIDEFGWSITDLGEAR